jgi:hypothetical protein
MTPGLAPAQSADVAWNEDKKHRGWTAHLHVGAEVIKYHLSTDHNTGDSELVSQTVAAAKDDGYQLEPAAVKVTR